MTEMSPIGSKKLPPKPPLDKLPRERQMDFKVKQGFPHFRCRNENHR